MASLTQPEKSDVVTLVAIERGFVLGRMIQPGQTFQFRTKTTDGKERKLPKWALLESAPKPAPRQPTGDLKPKDTQAAVAKKRGQLADGVAGAESLA